MLCRLAFSSPNDCIILALFASAVSRSLAEVVDQNARRLLVGDGSDKDVLPIAQYFEELARQLMQARKIALMYSACLDDSFL